MLSRDEIDLLQDCVREITPAVYYEYKGEPVGDASLWPPVIVNIGANVGTSSCAILEANPGAFVFSIDVKPYPEERENIIACGLDPTRIVRLLGDSAEIGTFFPYRPDMVFVDGGHHDEAVRDDIEAWQSKCKSIMLFHDYHHPNYAEKPGVNLDEIVDKAMADWERIGEARYLVAFRRG
jgi:precorrin-6B methylase 2